MKISVYAFDTGRRRVGLGIREEPNHVTVRMIFSRHGDLGDDDAIVAWLQGVMTRFQDDPRPLTFVGPDGYTHTFAGEPQLQHDDPAVERIDGTIH